ncbi:MAG: hypothetical protein H7281_14955 [Bacteriovorax sp.]|nr:hypothetical protein [Bacteriovorax sp.]
MKTISIIIFICFMAVAAIYLEEERNNIKKTVLSSSKAVGEKASQDLIQSTHEMQRTPIDPKPVVKFKSANINEAYELDEHELDELSKQLKNLKSVNQFDQKEFIPTNDTINREEREYYEPAE